MNKILLYNLSLVPLYIVFLIKTTDVKFFLELNKMKLDNFIINFYKPLIFIFLSLVGILTIFYLKKSVKKGNELSYKIDSFKRIDYEHLTFLATFILLIFVVDLKTVKDMIILFFILSFMGIIYIKSEMYYLNPGFLIFGWYLHKIKRKNSEVVALSTFKLEENIIFYRKKDR